ncbi:response regulator transcription factor [Mucilaginibacter mali]|uniref:Response regulator transcription factor n=1 Tax=Mucilaginibacter mali TaxID=2740462 RepID=A0A7D4UG01_9SPHI|nr:LytTR family DNA-binding domain-containing protein [Mucilaginibacter mali]QKJ31116.1 response regulator transcription factor [Mucilaginibacter mali]
MNTCYVIDDERHAIDTLTRYIAKLPGLQLIGSHINPLHAIDAVNRARNVDIVFLDVDMPELSGLEVADIISPFTSVIFTSAHAHYAVDAFEKNGIDFLLKPISFARFTKSVTKVVNAIASKKIQVPIQTHFFINPGIKGKVVRLDYNDILFIEGLSNYVAIYTTDQKHITYLSMKEVENAIPESRFIRIHKSYIVNIDKIKSVDGNHVILSKSIELPIGSSFKTSFGQIIDAITLKGYRKTY